MKSEIEKIANNPSGTLKIGNLIGSRIRGGEVIELVGDVGSGKTLLVRGLAAGFGSSDQVASPTFTISRIYRSKSLSLHHFDFYRLNDPGVIAAELAESIADPTAAVVIEWSDIVKDVLPDSRLRIVINVISEQERKFRITASDKAHQELIEDL